MSELTEQLQTFGRQHKGTDLGGLLQWAALHVDSQDTALAEAREELASEAAERQRLEGALHDAKTSMEGALAVLAQAWRPPVELARDFAPHINLMAAHGDADYLKKNGMSIRHVDCRETPRRKKGAA